VSTVWSCGGGTQSAGIAAKIVRGELPKPDVAVMADTGREASEVWRYYDAVLRPELAAVGVDLVRLPHSFEGTGWNTVDVWGGEDGKTMLVPMFTSHSGTIGQLPKYCSNEWKTRPVKRYCRSLGLTGGIIWIGFSIDELHRMRSFDPRESWNHAYPLIDQRNTRGDCIAVVERMGWPPPPRSACWMCSYRTRHEWKHLKRVDPDDFQRAVHFDHAAREIDPTLYLHSSGVPLDQVDFDAVDPQGDLLDQCASGMCFT
jgi:hypothetical protein